MRKTESMGKFMYKRNASMRALVGMFAGVVLAVGCGPTTGNEESALHQSRQAMRLQARPTLAGGSAFVLALRPNGEVWAWGDNQRGQLGDGTTTNRTSPVKTQGLPVLSGSTVINPVTVTAGYFFSVALLEDGNLRAWGENASGQLGDGTITNRHTPIQVSGISTVDAIAAGYYHTLALRSDGTVWAWGGNASGQLGDGTTTERHTPQQVPGLTNMVAVAAGRNHSLALSSNGTVWAWGYNLYGQLGNNATIDSTTPVQVQGLSSTVVDVEAGMYYSLAVLANGTVWGWGDNRYLQIGSNGGTQSRTAVQVPQLSGVTYVVGSPSSGYDHTIAVKGSDGITTGDGTVWTWGSNGAGQLGHGVSYCPYGSSYTTGTPTQPNNLTGAFTSVASSTSASFAQRADGTVWVWGTDSMGLWGDGGANGSCTQTPRQVPGLP
jgi:alpha-tubulin suppressor-like RCC1 family protein